jgi:hypothetical protein
MVSDSWNKKAWFEEKGQPYSWYATPRPNLEAGIAENLKLLLTMMGPLRP